jgi:endogenous inhibitor of DNA gyrase (YacG/DUF329 family)
MARVMVNCPATNKPVFTGMDFDKRTFESANISGNSFRCSECGSFHTWNKEDAHLEDDEEK